MYKETSQIGYMSLTVSARVLKVNYLWAIFTECLLYFQEHLVKSAHFAWLAEQHKLLVYSLQQQQVK